MFVFFAFHCLQVKHRANSATAGKGAVADFRWRLGEGQLMTADPQIKGHYKLRATTN